MVHYSSFVNKGFFLKLYSLVICQETCTETVSLVGQLISDLGRSGQLHTSPSTSYVKIKATIAATFIFRLLVFQLAKPAWKLIIAFPSANKSVAL